MLKLYIGNNEAKMVRDAVEALDNPVVIESSANMRLDSIPYRDFILVIRHNDYSKEDKNTISDFLYKLGIRGSSSGAVIQVVDYPIDYDNPKAILNAMIGTSLYFYTDDHYLYNDNDKSRSF